jgi:hypothetical protein
MARDTKRPRSFAKGKPKGNRTTNRTFEAMLTDTVVEKGRSIAVKMIAKRFAEAGIRLSARERAAFAEALTGDRPMPTIQRRRPRSAVAPIVALTSEDNREFSRQLRRLLKSSVAMIPRLADEAAEHSLTLFMRDWPAQQKVEQRSFDAFRRRLSKRWGESLDKLHLLIALARDFGGVVGATVRVPPIDRPYLVDIVTRLHARACQVSLEIHTLLSFGLADGAMARCRTLHEIAATAFFVHEHGEQTAERYVLHEAIESWRAACEYNRHARVLKMRPYKSTEMKTFEAARTQLLDRFGKSFDGHYGWASHILKPGASEPVRSFTDIEESVLPHLRPYYQLASHNVHAKAKGIYHRLGLLGDHEILLSGSSNSGLADPGQNAALFLCQVTTVLGLLHPTVETTMMMKAVNRLQQNTADAFGRAHHQLLKDERDARSTRRTRPSNRTEPVARTRR